MVDTPQHSADERGDEGLDRDDVAILEAAAWLRQAAKDSPDVGIMLNGIMTRLGVNGVGELARDHFAHFAVIFEAAQSMIEEIPEDQLHRIDAGKPAK